MHGLSSGQCSPIKDRDSTSERYGIWPMYPEEPLEVLRIPDWNYADFVGSQMVYANNN